MYYTPGSMNNSSTDLDHSRMNTKKHEELVKGEGGADGTRGGKRLRGLSHKYLEYHRPSMTGLTTSL